MSTDSYSIYQVLEGEDTRSVRYERLKNLRVAGGSVERANYELVYHNAFQPGTIHTPIQILEDLYRRFTTDCPLDFTGRPVGMGDVVMLRRDGEAKAYYCDYVGFEEVPEFLRGPFRYYSTQRPIDIGTLPKTDEKPEAIVNYDYRMPVQENNKFEAWGVVQYNTPLNDKDIEAYELRPSAYNTDRAFMPYSQQNERVQVVGRWESETGVPEGKRLTWKLPASERYVVKNNTPNMAISSRFRVISRDYWHGIDAQLARGKQQAEKDNTARPKPPKDKEQDER